MKIKRKFLKLKPSGARIQYIEAGDKGRPMLYLHGAGGHLPNDPFIAGLARKFRVHAPLLPGYGASTGEDDLRDMLGITLHCLDVMEALNLKKPIVLGHSMGGMIAAEMAAIAHNDIDRLALVAPAGLWIDAQPVVDIFSKLPFELPALLFHDEALGAKLMTAGVDLEDPEFLADFLVMNARRLGMAGKILFPIPDRGLAERLYRIRAKTLIVWGREDRLIAPVYGDRFRKAIAGARLVKIPKAGHLVTHEKPAAVVEAVRGYFSRSDD